MSRASPYPVVGAWTANEFSRDLPLAGEAMRRLFTGKDMLTDSSSIVSHRHIRYAVDAGMRISPVCEVTHTSLTNALL